MERIKNLNMDEKGRRGEADIVKLSDTKLRVDVAANDKEKAESFNIVVSEETIPEYFPFKQMKVNAKVKVSVTMNDRGDKILFANPWNGEFIGHFNKIPAPEGQEPVAETKKGRGGKKDYKQFAVLVEVDYAVGTKALWKGCNYWTPLYPNFGQDAEGNLAVAGTGSGSDKLFDFLEVTEVSSRVIPFSENPLPEIQKIAQEKNSQFKFIVVKGWVDTFVPLVAENAFEEEIGFTEEPVKETEAVIEETVEEEEVHPALSEE